MLAGSLKLQGIESTVFTTEATASWFYSPARRTHSQPVDFPGEVRIGWLSRAISSKEPTALRTPYNQRNFGRAFSVEHLGDQIAARVASAATKSRSDCNQLRYRDRCGSL